MSFFWHLFTSIWQERYDQKPQSATTFRKPAKAYIYNDKKYLRPLIEAGSRSFSKSVTTASANHWAPARHLNLWMNNP
jgi:hypothetical protein